MNSVHHEGEICVRGNGVCDVCGANAEILETRLGSPYRITLLQVGHNGAHREKPRRRIIPAKVEVLVESREQARGWIRR